MASPSQPLPDTLDHLPADVRAAVARTKDDGIPFRARTAYLHSTWAHTFSSLPELYIQPESPAEVEKAIRLAVQCRRRITTVGSGHSPSDLTCTASWLVNLDKMDAVLACDVDDTTTTTGNNGGATVTVQAGIRLFALGEELDRRGLAMPSLGSIDAQSAAGVIATGTHGSTLRHGLVSENVVALRIALADGTTRACSAADADPALFRAALLSLGALGIVTEMTLRVVPAFTLAWDQTIDADARVFGRWDRDLWTQAEFVRVWWFPYTHRAVVWKADRVADADLASGAVALRDPPVSYYDGWLGYVVYLNLLYISRWVPRIIPWVERFVFGMQYGFRDGPASRRAAVQPSRRALLMNCLYSQFVDEWALPLAKGPEALSRLGAWLNSLRPGDPGYVAHRIPFSADGLWVHSPVEVRVADTTLRTAAAAPLNNRPLLDPTCADGPTLYLNATMYRPYGLDPPADTTQRYYEAFEWLMRDLGGRPHWAKNFTATVDDVEHWYGDDLVAWRKVRDAVDPEGVFVGPWHRRHILRATATSSSEDAPDQQRLPCEEAALVQKRAPGGGWLLTKQVG